MFGGRHGCRNRKPCEELSCLPRELELTGQSPVTPMGMAWTCLVPCACWLCQPIWRIYVSDCYWCLFQMDRSSTCLPCHVTDYYRQTQLFLWHMAYLKCPCPTTAHHSLVLRFRNLSAGMLFIISSLHRIILLPTDSPRKPSRPLNLLCERCLLDQLRPELPSSFSTSVWRPLPLQAMPRQNCC